MHNEVGHASIVNDSVLTFQSLQKEGLDLVGLDKILFDLGLDCRRSRWCSLENSTSSQRLR